MMNIRLKYSNYIALALLSIVTQIHPITVRFSNRTGQALSCLVAPGADWQKVPPTSEINSLTWPTQGSSDNFIIACRTEGGAKKRNLTTTFDLKDNDLIIVTISDWDENSLDFEFIRQ